MQQELIDKKREIINIFLKNGILINSELLKRIEDGEQISKLIEILNTKSIGESAAAETNLSDIFLQQKAQILEEQKQVSPKKKQHQNYILLRRGSQKTGCARLCGLLQQ